METKSRFAGRIISCPLFRSQAVGSFPQQIGQARQIRFHGWPFDRGNICTAKTDLLKPVDHDLNCQSNLGSLVAGRQFFRSLLCELFIRHSRFALDSFFGENVVQSVKKPNEIVAFPLNPPAQSWRKYAQGFSQSPSQFCQRRSLYRRCARPFFGLLKQHKGHKADYQKRTAKCQ